MATRNDFRRALLPACLVLVCLTLAACEDRREPVKPKVAATQSGATHSGA